MNEIINFNNEVLTMSSREIASITGKEHKHVMRDIRSMLDSLSISPDLDPCVKSSTYIGKDGREYSQYELDKDTTICLIAGYDTVVRMKIIKRWQELEAQQSQFTELTREQKLAYALIASSEIIEEQKAEIKQLSASLKVEHQIANIARAAVVMGDADIQLTKFAKSIEDSFTRDNGAPLGRTTFYKILRDWNILTQENLATGYASARKWALVKQSGYYMRGDKKVPNLICYITPKGQEYVINRLYQDKEELGLTIKEYN